MATLLPCRCPATDRQLGDALEAVLEHLKADAWKGESKQAVDASRLQLAEIRRLKTRREAVTRGAAIRAR